MVPEQVGHMAACIFPERVILAIMYTDHMYIAKQKAPISCAATAQSICAADFACTENLFSQDAAKYFFNVTFDHDLHVFLALSRVSHVCTNRVGCASDNCHFGIFLNGTIQCSRSVNDTLFS